MIPFAEVKNVSAGMVEVWEVREVHELLGIGEIEVEHVEQVEELELVGIHEVEEFEIREIPLPLLSSTTSIVVGTNNLIIYFEFISQNSRINVIYQNDSATNISCRNPSRFNRFV